MNLSLQTYYQQIVSYYEGKLGEFNDGINRQTLAIHAGFSDEKVEDYAETLVHMNEVLAERAEIKAGQQILDAGCGVGVVLSGWQRNGK